MAFNKGFTIIEVIVAMTIMSFMMLGMYSITENGINSKDTIVKEDRNYLQTYTALNRLSQDFNQIYSPLYFNGFEIKDPNKQETNQNPYGNQEGNVFKPTENFQRQTANGLIIPQIRNESQDDFIFMTMANRRKIQGQKQSRYAWVRYSIQDNDIEADDPNYIEGSVLMRQFDPNYPYSEDIDWTKVNGQILLRGVQSVKFSFWSPKKKDWVRSLKEVGEVDQLAPKALKVEIEIMGIDKVKRPFTRVFRPLWPFFDVDKDQREILAAKKNSSKKPGGSSGQPQ